MKVREYITIERLESGLYRVTKIDGSSTVGAAASTIIVLATAIFFDEASESASGVKNMTEPVQ